MTNELYDALGVPPDATPEDIKANYRAKAKQHHPDAGGDAERFGEIQRAYDVLSDPDKRERYDKTGTTDTMNQADRIEAMARERFGTMLIDSVQDSDSLTFTHNWISEALGVVEADRKRFKAELKTLKKKAEQADALAARFKPKTQRNIPRDVLSHVKRDIARMVGQVEERLEVVARLEVLLKEYDFEADEAPENNPYGMTDAQMRAHMKNLRDMIDRTARKNPYGGL